MTSNSVFTSAAAASAPSPAGAAIATAGAAALTPQYSSRNLTNLLICRALILSSSATNLSNSLGTSTLVCVAFSSAILFLLIQSAHFERLIHLILPGHCRPEHWQN